MLKGLIQKSLKPFGRQIIDLSYYDFLTKRVELCQKVKPLSIFYSEATQNEQELIAPFLPFSKAQIAQDLFAIAIAGSRDPRFFVDFGATNGIHLNNTWLLEKHLNWQGIVAEPAKCWHKELKQNRNSSIDFRCVAMESNLEVDFLEANAAELSTMAEFGNNGDWASAERINNSHAYKVQTVSLDDLLDAHNAPSEIQFLSIDTEGSEFEILSNYNFNGRKINSICVEHNYVHERRKSINQLLTSRGYKQIFKSISDFDDWYVLK